MNKEGYRHGILLHLYTPDNDRRPENKKSALLRSRPGVYGRLVIAAVRELQKQGLSADDFILAGRSGFGESTPLSILTANQLIKTAQVTPERIRLNPESTLSTLSELKFAKKVAKDNGLNTSYDLLDISYGLHKPRVELLAQRIFGKTHRINTTFRSAEEILLQIPNKRDREKYKRIIDNLHTSEQDKKFSAYEQKILNLISFRISLGPARLNIGSIISEALNILARFYRPRVEK